ncbi:CGNR zinc finger domain-containing protein [Nocardiopsis coralliicola]
MAAVLGLDPGPYRGTYKLIGGALCLDFANLVSYRGTARQHDWLSPEGNAARWREAVALPHAALDGVSELVGFREILARAFLAVADGQTPDPECLGRIRTAALASRERARLEFPRGATHAAWVDDTPRLTGLLALDAVQLLTSSESLPRVRACQECRWVFLDTSRNRSRRWCDPADCGNRARQRRHYSSTQRTGAAADD